MQETTLFPETIPNWIGGDQITAEEGETIPKYSPHTGVEISKITRSKASDSKKAIDVAKAAQKNWAEIPPVQRGNILHAVCNYLELNKELVAKVVAIETGKSFQEALGETGGAIALGRFFAGEGQRLYGRTTTSAQEDKYAITVRQPYGVAGLIVAANTPIANVAWKVFPALICGNGVVLKAPEDSPAVSWLFAKLAFEAGLPEDILNVIQGIGKESGAPIVESTDVSVLSFTGSTEVGRWIAEIAGKRLAKVSLELGGKNPFVVCDDADIEHAVKWACLSAFSNAGQRCAAGSRIIVFDSIYDAFKARMVEEANKLKVGPADDDDLGPVINERQLNNILSSIDRAKSEGANVLAGGERIKDEGLASGYYLRPTVIDNLQNDQSISRSELFGPVAQLYRVSDFHDALSMANNSPYGLTACIHTQNFDRATHFTQKVDAGVVVVNAGTYGSEPHMPFGGVKSSGNGTTEPGTEALDVYSCLKDIYTNVNRSNL